MAGLSVAACVHKGVVLYRSFSFQKAKSDDLVRLLVAIGKLTPIILTANATPRNLAFDGASDLWLYLSRLQSAFLTCRHCENLWHHNNGGVTEPEPRHLAAMSCRVKPLQLLLTKGMPSCNSGAGTAHAGSTVHPCCVHLDSRHVAPQKII